LRRVTIDGRQLSYVGTGLALVTSELIRAWDQLGYSAHLTVFVEPGFDPTIYDLGHAPVTWVPISYRDRRPDYLGRLAWAKAVCQQLRQLDQPSRHFIPYLYNYGDLKHNVVLIPDLVYRIIPDYGMRDPSRPWWSLRGRLPIRPLFRRWEEWRASQAQQLVVYSAFVQDHVHQVLQVPKSRMALVPLAAPSWMQVDHDPTRGDELHDRLDLPNRFVLYVGGFAPRKNIPLLLRACGAAYQQDPSFRCVMVGLTVEKIQQDASLRSAFAVLGVQDAIVCCPRLAYADLATIYRLAAFTVYPSLNEGFGLPILEAAAAGKLCLCGDNSSMVEIQETDYRVDSADQLGWTQKMLYFWQNTPALTLASDRCLRLNEKFSWQQSATILWALLQR